MTAVPNANEDRQLDQARAGSVQTLRKDGGSLIPRNTLALLSLKAYGYGGGIFMVFYGVASLLRGYLIFRSGDLPKFLGVLLAFAGLGFVTRNFALVLAPAYAFEGLLLPIFLAALSLTGWLLVRGVDVSKWEEKAATLR